MVMSTELTATTGVQPTTLTHRKGEYLLLTAGSYSNYGPLAIVRVEKDIDMGLLAKVYALCLPPKTRKEWFQNNGRPCVDSFREVPDDSVDKNAFLAFLIARGYVSEVPYEEINFEDYNAHKIDFIRDVENQVSGRRCKII
jgi:hypothetical protein